MRIRWLLLFLALPLALVDLGVVPSVHSEDSSPARLTYVKVFKGSLPEYILVTVDENGEATYQGGSAEEPDAPESLRLSRGLTGRLFALAAQLNYFQGIELEAGKQVANMGQKTFLYEKDGQRNEVSYNYSRNAAAETLRELFEGIARGRYLVRQLEHRLVFDRLGLMETLREFERDLNAGHLVDLEQFAPVLEKIADDSRLMQLARSRAHELLQRIRGAPARLHLEYGDQEAGWYYKVVLVQGGSATYEGRRFDQPPNPQLLKLPPAALHRLWELVHLENNFRTLTDYRELPGRLSGYRFTYLHGAEHHQVSFYAPPDAITGEIVHLFQQVLQQQYYRDRLQAALEKESLMLQVVLQGLEKAVRDDKLIDSGEFAPLLEGIAKGDNHHPVVREQAQRLLARIHAASE